MSDISPYGLPHRVGGALVVFGEENGSAERAPNHELHPATYGPGMHKYFPTYPTTEPSNCVVKVAGTLGEEGDQNADYTKDTLPKNILTIICYKTELNHYIPDRAAYAIEIPTYDSSNCLWDTGNAYEGNTGKILNYYVTPNYIPVPSEYDEIPNWTQTYITTPIANSFKNITDVTDFLDKENPPPPNITTAALYPRWTAEEPWVRVGYQLFDSIEIQPDGGVAYWQMRDGTSSTTPVEQNPVEWFSPWYVVTDGGVRPNLNIFCDFSYKFTNAGSYQANTVEYSIVHPWNPNGTAYDPNDRATWYYQPMPDNASWQYEQDQYGTIANHYPTGGYRTVETSVQPNPTNGYSYVNYESKSTHGLFLSANGSCWNLGTTLKIKVYIYKTTPKNCFFPNNQIDQEKYPYTYDGQSYAYSNWQQGTPGQDGSPGVKRYYPVRFYSGGGYFNSTLLPGPMRKHNDEFQGFETGVPTGLDYTSATPPSPINLLYWGCAFAPDYDNEEEVEVLDITVTLDETNTYKCDGSERPDVEYTQFGFKIQDIELEPEEGFIKYIKDYEVYEVIKPGG